MYCRNCGAEIKSDAPFCQSCGVSAGSGNTYCANCGTQSVPGSVFCSHCGCQFAPDPQPAGQAYYQDPSQQSSNPMPGYQPPVYPPVPHAPLKSKMAAGLLGIFLGAFGVHNFYLGYTTKAVIQLCLTILSCGILSPASGIWGFIEGILILSGSISVDGNGMPLGD